MFALRADTIECLNTGGRKSLSTFISYLVRLFLWDIFMHDFAVALVLETKLLEPERLNNQTRTSAACMLYIFNLKLLHIGEKFSLSSRTVPTRLLVIISLAR